MDIIIESASSLLLERLYEIEKQCFNKEAFSKQQISYLLTDYNSVSLVAWMEGELSGFIVGIIEFDESTLVGHIITLDVAPRFWRKGVAQRLLSELEGMFRQKEIKESYLEVREDNYSALSLYLKFGYQKIAKLQNYYPSAHGIYLRKSL